MAVTEIRVKLIGDLNVQIKGPGKLRLSFLPKLFWLLRNEFAETTNLIHFLLGSLQVIKNNPGLSQILSKVFLSLSMQLSELTFLIFEVWS